MNSYKYIKIEDRNDVFSIILNRPRHNVMNIDMIGEINDSLEFILGKDYLKAVLFRGDGISWCAGVDVSDHKPGVVGEMIDSFSKMFFLIHSLKVPTIASVHGACLGGGMELAIACDIVIASEDSFFGQPEIKLGFLPPYAAVRLPSLVGPSKTLEVLLTGRRFNATEAFQFGLLSKVCYFKDEKLSEYTEKILNEIRENSPIIIRLNKKAVMNSIGLDFGDALKKVNDIFLLELMNSDDVKEGIRSFEDKRKPVWLNK